MQEILKRKKIIYAVITLVVAFAVYSFFFGGSGNKTEVVTIEKPVLSDESIKGRDLLKVLLSLNGIKLDEEIFASRLFTGLRDFGISLPPTSVVGRENPFAPLGSEESQPAAQRAATTTKKK
ncbi:MAG: hypothetical protein AAB355_01120 [Patescibacteria group bacterium]